MARRRKRVCVGVRTSSGRERIVACFSSAAAANRKLWSTRPPRGGSVFVRAAGRC